MKFVKWLKEVFVDNLGVLFIAIALTAFCVIALNTLLNLG